MAISPNYSWPLPDDTSLVKNGAEAIRDLGNAIDNTVENLPSGALVHIETADLAGKSAQNFNDVFTSTFRNYKIIYDCLHSTSSDVRIRYRVAESDNSTSNYNNQLLVGASNAASASISASQTILTGSGTSGASQGEFLISNPNNAIVTNSYATVFTGSNNIRLTACFFGANTVFDGFSIFPNTGTFTSGSISVYGLKD